MPTPKALTLSLFLGIIALTDFVQGAEADSQDLFKLDEDNLIIQPSMKPAMQPESNALSMEEEPMQEQQSQPRKEKITPDAATILSIMNRIQESGDDKPAQRQEPLELDTDIYDEDLDMDNFARDLNNTELIGKKRIIDVSDNRRPIYGVLTEPLRGDLQDSYTGQVKHSVSTEEMSYISKAHVQFLEQSGVIVVPISYLDSEEEILSKLKEVNGVYICGDSHTAIANDKFQDSFASVLKYVSDANKIEKDYFPMFLMGKASQTFVKQVGLSDKLHNMRDYRNKNVKIDLLKDHADTFLLHQLQFDDSHAEAFPMGEFFNRQHSGFRLKDINIDDRLKKWITPLATFKGSAWAKHELTMDDVASRDYQKENEFVAIAEGIDLPLYMFTYNMEMTQFVFTDLMKAVDQEEVIDKSIMARHHA